MQGFTSRQGTTTGLPPTPPVTAGRVLSSTGLPGNPLTATSWAPVASAIAGPWTNVTLASGVTATAGTLPQYRVVGDRVELRGYFRNVTAQSQVPLTVGTIPAGAAPTAETVYIGFNANLVSPTNLNIRTNGEIQLYSNPATTNHIIGVYGISYSLTTEAAVAPAFSSTFLTTQPTSWVTLAPALGTQSTPPLQYRLNGDRVELRGFIGGVTAGATNPTTVAILPVGFRPPAGETAIPAFSPAAAKNGSVLILSTGEVRWYGPALNNESISFSGIDFSVSSSVTAAPTGVVGTAWTALPVVGAATSRTQEPIQYRLVGDEVQLRGGWNNVTTASQTSVSVGTLPVGFRPPRDQVHVGYLNSGFDSTGIVLTTAGDVQILPTAALSAASVTANNVRFCITP